MAQGRLPGERRAAQRGQRQRVTPVLRRAGLVCAMVCVAGACTPPPRLHVDMARVDFPDVVPGKPGRFEMSGSYENLRLDPKLSVRLDVVGESTRWLFLKPVAHAPMIYAVDGEEHGYAMILDVARRQVTLIEPDVFPHRTNPVEIKFGQDEKRLACVRLWFAEAGRHWTLNEANGRQAACEP